VATCVPLARSTPGGGHRPRPAGAARPVARPGLSAHTAAGFGQAFLVVSAIATVHDEATGEFAVRAHVLAAAVGNRTMLDILHDDRAL
jgi:hypothetical protein